MCARDTYGEETEQSADRASDESQACFADGGSGAFERNKTAGDERRANPRPVERHVLK